MGVPLLMVSRLLAAGFFLLTAGYAVLHCSPFAVDMFIRPQLFPWLATFVAWHHLWFAAAWGVSAVSLAPRLDWRRHRTGWDRRGHHLAIGYVLVVGLASAWLMAHPVLPVLWDGGRALPTALAALVPLVWLAVIDHMTAPSGQPSVPAYRPVSQYRLLVTCGAATLFLWGVHLARAATVHESGSAAAWGLAAAWTLALTAAVFAIVYATFCLVSALAVRSRWPCGVERALIVALLAAGIAEFVRRVVFPTVSIDGVEAVAVASMAGLAMAGTWSGLAGRRRHERAPSALALLVAPGTRMLPALLGLAALSVLSFWTLAWIARMDWSFVLQRSLIAIEFVLAFGLCLTLTASLPDRPYSPRRMRLAPGLVLVALLGLPPVASLAASARGDLSLAPAVAFSRGPAAEVAFALLADALVRRPGFDADYYRFLQSDADVRGRAAEVPDIDFRSEPVRAPAGGPPPDIYLLVIDSLRRDYLSPYNPAVTFTPAIGAFAAEGFVFRNAFTRHGGTELSIPSIWAGAMMVRAARSQPFHRMNALEKLVHAHGYRVAINDFTISEHLRTSVTTIDPGVPSVQTDLCQNLESLARHQAETAQDPRPLFTYLAPMNVHILNTRRGGQGSLDGDYPGFHAPYASRLRRIDACFGAFVDALKSRGRYDNSLIVITSDHGESLGENGYWGHGTWLFPEAVRLPIIVHLPPGLRETMTTDLARLAFSTDIAPTLYALLGHDVRDLGPLFGEPLFVPSDRALPDRRRRWYLLTSSYGAAFGLVGRNGRTLYISDLLEWREFAYDLSVEPNGRLVAIEPDVRLLNQRRIRAQLSLVSELYQPAK
jgi:hypothetical protein